MKQTYFISGYLGDELELFECVRYQETLDDIIKNHKEGMVYKVEDKTNKKLISSNLGIEDIKTLSVCKDSKPVVLSANEYKKLKI